jgi:hypothetical protein
VGPFSGKSCARNGDTMQARVNTNGANSISPLLTANNLG